jgi:hypothetical protein
MMKSEKTVITEIVISSILVLVCIGQLLSNATSMAEKMQFLKNAQTIANQVIVLDRQNYVAQARYWAYVNSPSDEKSKDFSEASLKVEDEYKKLLSLVENNPNAVCEGCLGKTEVLASNLKEIEKMVEPVLAALADYEEAVSATPSTGSKELLKSSTVLEKVANLRQEVSKADSKFKELDFDNTIFSFVVEQNKKAEEIEKSFSELRQWNNVITVILAVVYLLLLALIAMWLGMVTRDLKRHKDSLKNKIIKK